MLLIDDLPIKIFTQGVLLYIKVTPNASCSKIGKVLNENLKLYVATLPENGQANKLVIELLMKKLQISRNNISIIKGLTSQYKVLKLIGNKDDIVRSLQIII